MKEVISDEKGQLILLTGFLIVLEVVIFITLLNNMIYTTNMPSTGLDIAKKDIREARTITESDIKAGLLYANTSVADITNQTQVNEYFLNYMKSYNETLRKIYGSRGASVEIIINNVSFNRTTSSLTVNKYFVERKSNTFNNRSLIIPMDDNQSQLIRVYGLIYNIVDDTGSSGLNSTRIPVWEILQNGVNSSVTNFSSTISTDSNASLAVVGTLQSRSYSGGPFIIDANDINSTQRDMILTEAASKGITVHELYQEFYYDRSVKMIVPPKVAAYPSTDLGPMESYYLDGGVPYTALSNTDILNGNLSQYDILTIPHHNMNAEPANVITAIVGWVANGGVTHIECEGTDTMDTAVESSSAGSAKPWYGLIGTSKSKKLPNGTDIANTGIKLLDNSTRYNATFSYNGSPPMPLSGLADPGAPFSPLAQSHNASGIFGVTGGSTTAFSLRDNAIDVNPDTNILGYGIDANGAPVYDDFDADGIKEMQLMYLEAPYDNGLVIYVAGHNLTKRTGKAERLIFESFFTASMRRQEVTVVSTQSVNVTLRYSDGNVNYEDTFEIPMS